METYSGNDFQEQSLPALQLTTDTDSPGTDQPTQTRIRLRIPKEYTDQPVISRLVSDYGLTVNIAAALLGQNARDDGWFDLKLQGTSDQIQSALTYLNDRNFEIWSESDTERGDW